MVNKKRVAFATGSRADYGIVRKYLDLLNQDENIDLSILVTGALLSDKFAHQVDLIEQDGFKIDAKIKIPTDTANTSDTTNAMANALKGFGEYFQDNKYDLLIILGDRFEIFSVAIAASMHRIPILHLHGGEATFANYDEFIRHSITKMSLYHFTSCEDYKNRVIQLGENPQNVFNLGALGAENCCFINEDNVSDDVKQLELKNYFVILFHPETISDTNPEEQIQNLLDSIKLFTDYKFVFIGSNADTHSDKIRNKVLNFVENDQNAIYFENLHPDGYHYLLKNSICLIGNSSSGIIEAPSLGIYTINIGERQKGRVRGNSIVDTACDVVSITNAIKNVLDMYKTIKPINPYYQENSADKYYKKTQEILNKNNSVVKIFYDLITEEKEVLTNE